MRIAFRLLIGIVGVIVVGVVASQLVSGQNARPTIATEEDFRRAMKELSNWGRWGEMDELGAAQPDHSRANGSRLWRLHEKGGRSRCRTTSPQEKAADTPTFLDRALVTVAPNVTAGPLSVHGHLPWRGSQPS